MSLPREVAVAPSCSCSLTLDGRLTRPLWKTRSGRMKMRLRADVEGFSDSRISESPEK
jgi:hypothetical protein